MKISAHYISGTHFDREWYRPFQEFRFLFVKLVDHVLDALEKNDAFRHFQLDGVTCLLDDYLEVRPESRERLGRLIRDGRFLIGPWFTMPDLFCVGDEALVRNLLLGRRISRSWGVEPMPVGFVPDMFGHPSQMPQIFSGFGYQSCVLGRGTNEHTTPAFFSWEAPDGSRVFTFKLQDEQGYGAFALPRAALEDGRWFFVAKMKEFCADMKAANGDPREEKKVRERHFRIESSKYIQHEIHRSNGAGVLCLMDSMDHTVPATEVNRYLDLLREVCPEVLPRHSTLPQFFEEARRQGNEVTVKRGELREPSRDHCEYLQLIPNCPSARVGIKQLNDKCQNLLEKWADPFVAIANLHGADIPEKHLEIAWRHLLLNHAHDSIGGCSIDQVHRDMIYRFDQSRILAEQLRVQSIGFLTSAAGDLARDEHDFTVTVVNPLPWAVEETVVFDIDLPPDYPTDFSESYFSHRIKSFSLEDSSGNRVPFQRLGHIPLTNERSRYAQFGFQSDGEFSRYTVAARLSMPGLGFSALRVAPSPRPSRTMGTLRTGPVSAENEFLSLSIGTNGTLILTDKESGETYRDLLLFEDRSEIGDGWFHVHSENDEQHLSAATPAQVSVVHDGPEVVSFRIRITLRIPERFEKTTQFPAAAEASLRISSHVLLRRGARVAEVETTVENSAEDHRLRLLLPTDCPEAGTYLAHQPFDFVERKITLNPETAEWREIELAEKPFLGIQAVGSGSRGLAFLSPSALHEGGVVDDARRTMLVTLQRSFRQTIATGGETDGLEKGRLSVNYALMPFSGRFPRTRALAELARLQAGVLTCQTGKRPSGYPPMDGKAEASRGFIECRSGRLAVSAIKTPECGEGLVLRLWNPEDQAQSEEIVFWKDIHQVRIVMLNEDSDPAATAPEHQGNRLTVFSPPRRITTVLVTFQKS